MCQEESRLSQKARLFCRSDSVGVEDVRGKEEVGPAETGRHYLSSLLQRKAGQKEVRHLDERREREEEKRRRIVEEKEGERKARSSAKRKLVQYRKCIIVNVTTRLPCLQERREENVNFKKL